jgi:BCD family chlorophyll transporter-like MFS transporter
VALLYVMLLVGMMMAAFVIGRLLADFTPTKLVQVVQGTAVLTVAFNLIALWKQEGRHSRAPDEDEPDFSAAWREFVRRPGIARLLTAIGLGAAAFAMQDALLEPFGGEILSLSVGQTTGLTGGWAFGTLAGFALAARFLDRGFDPLRIAGFGLAGGIIAFMMLIFAAPLDQKMLVVIGAQLIGLGGGLFSVGTLVEAMSFADRASAGLALGAWGAVQASCAGLAIAFGGLARDLVSALATQDAFGPILANRATGYGAVYLIEICLLVGAIVVIGPLVGRVRGPGQARQGRFGLMQFPA